jgi:hypothetical protein
MALVQLERLGGVSIHPSPPLLVEDREAVGGLPVTEDVCPFERLKR